METARVEENIARLTASVSRFLDRASDYAKSRLPGYSPPCSPPRVMNNFEWHKDLNLLDFLRTAGTQARVNSMLARER
jgi:tyrosyl-tRNA synthetase